MFEAGNTSENERKIRQILGRKSGKDLSHLGKNIGREQLWLSFIVIFHLFSDDWEAERGREAAEKIGNNASSIKVYTCNYFLQN
jgi:hypothetical protein